MKLPELIAYAARAAALTLFLGVCAALALPGEGRAQNRQPDALFALELEWMGASVGYARPLGPRRYWGVEAGLGGSFWGRMLLAGDRFSHRREGAGGGAGDTRLTELVHMAVLRRWVPSPWVTWDVGLRASLLYNSGPFDDDPAFPSFIGAHSALLAGGRRVQVGPRLMAGLFADGSGAREMGLYLAPFVARITVGW